MSGYQSSLEQTSWASWTSSPCCMGTTTSTILQSTQPSPMFLPAQLSDLGTLLYRVCWSELYTILNPLYLILPCYSLVTEVQFERKKSSTIPLSDTFFNPELMYVPGELDKFLVGLATQPSQKFDNIFTEQVTNHLF